MTAPEDTDPGAAQPPTPSHHEGTEGGAAQPRSRRLWPSRRRRVRTRALVLAGSTTALLLAAAAVWITARGLLARAHLMTTQAEIAALENTVRSDDRLSEAQLRLRIGAINRETAAARRLTGDPLWALLGHTPGLGCPSRAVRSMVAAVHQIVTESRPLVEHQSSLFDPDSIRVGTAIRIDRIAAARQDVEAAHGAIASFRRTLDTTPTCGAIGRAIGLDGIHTTVLARIDRLERTTTTLSLATLLMPPMMGADGPRRYLLVVQNPAESRATGGIIGAFGLLTVDNGRFELTEISGNGKLPGGPTQRVPAMELPSELESLYGAAEPTRVWANANLTPHYPTVGEFYTALYQAGTGVRVDGTISIDPTTLAYLLAATRPAVLPDGRVVRAEELVEFVESRVYAEIIDVWERDRFFATVGRAVYEAAVAGGGSTGRLLSALGRAATEGRLLLSSNHPAEQSVIETTALGGALPEVDGPYLAVITQNAAASKLDFWLRRSTEYRSVRRRDGSADVTITVRVTNAAPAGLSDYVRLRADKPAPDGSTPPRNNPDAQNLLLLSVYTGRGSGLQAATLDGRPSALLEGYERGRPVFSATLAVNRGQTRTLVLRVWEPVARPVVPHRPQPLVTPENVNVEGVRFAAPWSRFNNH